MLSEGPWQIINELAGDQLGPSVQHDHSRRARDVQIGTALRLATRQ